MVGLRFCSRGESWEFAGETEVNKCYNFITSLKIANSKCSDKNQALDNLKRVSKTDRYFISK